MYYKNNFMKETNEKNRLQKLSSLINGKQLFTNGVNGYSSISI